MKPQKRMGTICKILTFLALNKPHSKWELSKTLNKSYGNIHKTMQQLLDGKLIKIEYKKPSSKNMKVEVKYYGLTLRGLLNTFSLNQELWKHINVIAERHSDKLLIFRKWPFFISKNIEKTVISNFQMTLVSAIYVSDIALTEGYKIKYEDLTDYIDSYVLGSPVLTLSNQRIKEVYGDNFFKLWKACKEDSELKVYIECEIKNRKRQTKQRLDVIKQREEWFSKS